MAAVMPGDESPLRGHSSRADRSNGLGVVHCFVCGSGVTPGKELRLQVNYQEKGPFFPFLQNQEPAPGACELNPDGHVQACAVCHCFLAEQWNSFERSRTPIEKRMYWLKRPYQCDSRRVPQEWNISYDLERRISVGSQNYEGADSDFSSFSDNENMSDQELDLVDQRAAVVPAKDKSVKTSGKVAKDNCRKSVNVVSVKSSPDSQRASRYSVGVFGTQGSPRADSLPPTKRGAKMMNHVVAQSNDSPSEPQERGRRRCYDDPLPDTPVRNRQWLAEGNPRHVEQQRQIQGDAYSSSSSSTPSRHPSLQYHGRGGEDALMPPVRFKSDTSVPQRNTQRGLQNPGPHSEEDDVNITSEEDDHYDRKVGSSAHLRRARDLSARGGSLAHPHHHHHHHHHPPPHRQSSGGAPLSGGHAEAHVCFICGGGLRHDWRFSVSVQKQERAQDEPFFPFLWLHAPPPGAMAISAAGTTLVCGRCHASLLQQWQGFQLADVPVLQRLYVVPLNQAASSGTGAPHPPAPPPPPPPPPALHAAPAPVDSVRTTESRGGGGSPHEGCFLCGQECGRELRVAYAQAGVGKSRAAMYFPFIGMLPCPPNAQPLRAGRVHCCPPCHGLLEDIWAAYRLSLSEDLITSVSSFLVRYHAASATAGPRPTGPPPPPPQPHFHPAISPRTPGAGSACYLCGAELGPGADHQLHVNPPGRCGEKEAFFPFLTVHPPAPRAKPVDATGLVTACALCYHDLHAQWARHEGQGPTTPTAASASGGAAPQPASSPWARQYHCEAFMCFFCRQEHPRVGGLCAVTVARLPVFLYAPRGRRTLLVDDGQRLLIGSCVECRTLVQAGHGMRTDARAERGDGHPALEDGEGNEATPPPPPPRTREKVGHVGGCGAVEGLEVAT